MDEKEKIDMISYKSNINRSLGKRNDGKLLDYEEAEKSIVEYIKKKRLETMKTNSTEKPKTKEDLRQDMQLVRKYVTDCILNENMSIRNYQGEKVETFIEDMVHEYAAYSILDDAFSDPTITDIYCIDSETIFVEKDGVNVKYWKKFRSPEHYATVVERFLRTNGKQLNVGENKIVDFELYQDRGCATSKSVSPRDITLTIRKHAEEHITLDNLLEWGCLNEEIANLFGLIIDGESNLIVAGITGSGKTTLLRTILDKFVARNGRRMLICEDTQELFPKNEHTIELVSVKGDKPSTSVTLAQIILTALRLKPKYIVVGEVRGEEAMAATEGMETAHSTLTSMHGGTPINIVNRIVTKYLTAMPALGIDVVERIIGSAIDYVAIIDNVPNIGRKVTNISEIGYDFEKGRVTIKPIFKFDFRIKDFVMVNRIDQEKADKMMRRGVPIEELESWIDTGDVDTEREAIRKFNEAYQAAKPEREEIYKQRAFEKRETKLESLKEITENDIQNSNMIKKVIVNEKQKEQEKINRLNQINKMGDGQ